MLNDVLCGYRALWSLDSEHFDPKTLREMQNDVHSRATTLISVGKFAWFGSFGRKRNCRSPVQVLFIPYRCWRKLKSTHIENVLRHSGRNALFQFRFKAEIRHSDTSYVLSTRWVHSIQNYVIACWLRRTVFYFDTQQLSSTSPICTRKKARPLKLVRAHASRLTLVPCNGFFATITGNGGGGKNTP